MAKSKKTTPTDNGSQRGDKRAGKQSPEANKDGTRETIESILVAIILAFLFRAFVAEAFVIPTGSMAPTLKGRHMDVACKQCGHKYQTGASMENRDSHDRGFVEKTICPVCRYDMEMSRSGHEVSFSGDRILVSKFDYALHDPARWDVIVFKFPQGANQNYIKRLIGLPNERVKLKSGDVWVRKLDEDDFRIARKPNKKLLAMLQTVDDTDHISTKLAELGWPSRWQPVNRGQDVQLSRKLKEDQSASKLTADADSESWLRYVHLPASQADWDVIIDRGELPEDTFNRKGELITDFYGYNAKYANNRLFADSEDLLKRDAGTQWVGDLGVEYEVHVQSDKGQLLLDLTEGGEHHLCVIDLASGEATLSFDTDATYFTDDEGVTSFPERKASTSIRGKGKYKLRYTNVDNELRLWINKRQVKFDGPTTYAQTKPRIPSYSPTDPGDAAPIGIGVKDGSIEVARRRVLRDIYYLAMRQTRPTGRPVPEQPVSGFARQPESWSALTPADFVDEETFELAEGQFFPLGDNSPESSDARYWSSARWHVDRELLIGKALLIYWPHPWYKVLPNLGRMGFIR